MTNDDLKKVYQEEKAKNKCRWCIQFEKGKCAFVPGNCNKDNPFSLQNYYYSKPWSEIEDELIALYVKKIEDENKEYASDIAEAKQIIKEILCLLSQEEHDKIIDIFPQYREKLSELEKLIIEKH